MKRMHFCTCCIAIKRMHYYLLFFFSKPCLVMKRAIFEPAHGIMILIAYMRTAKAQARPRIRAVSPTPSHIYIMELVEGIDQESDI